MKYLYYNGDSFCGDGVTQWGEDAGGEEVVESSESFGQLLGDRYNLEVNHAWRGGSSSYRIYRTSINYIMNNVIFLFVLLLISILQTGVHILNTFGIITVKLQ